MSQHDYDIANGAGATVRADINNVLLAIVTNNSGNSAPSPTFANQWWADTTNSRLKRRNNANNAWIDVCSLTFAFSTIGESIATAADAAAVRTLLSLGTAALKNTGTSGDALGLLNVANDWSGQQTFAEGSLTDGTGTVAWNLSTHQVTRWGLGGNRTIGTPTNMKAGGIYGLRPIQGAGGQTITWNAVFKWPGGTPPTLSTGAGDIDLFVFWSDGTYMYNLGQSLDVG